MWGVENLLKIKSLPAAAESTASCPSNNARNAHWALPVPLMDTFDSALWCKGASRKPHAQAEQRASETKNEGPHSIGSCH